MFRRLFGKKSKDEDKKDEQVKEKLDQEKEDLEEESGYESKKEAINDHEVDNKEDLSKEDLQEKVESDDKENPEDIDNKNNDNVIQKSEEKSKDENAEANEIQDKSVEESEEKIESSSEKHKNEEIQNEPSDKTEVQEDSEDNKEEKKGIFASFFEGLTKTRDNITSAIDSILSGSGKIDDDVYESLEDILVMADIGASTTMEIIERLQERVKEKKIKDPAELKPELNHILKELLDEDGLDNTVDLSTTPKVILVVGVNGVGKTTSIGKLAKKFKDQGKSVMFAAADTFRAAAVDQLGEWAKRTGVEMISGSDNADPGSVVYDAISAAKARKTDILIVDTAGRLHNVKNLMNELNKIYRIIEKEYNESSVETLLVLDATTGQNAMNQAKQFSEAAKLNGIILTKMDGTAKGGVVIRIQSELKIPVKFIGLGEGVDDLKEFNPSDFIDSIIS